MRSSSFFMFYRTWELNTGGPGRFSSSQSLWTVTVVPWHVTSCYPAIQVGPLAANESLKFRCVTIISVHGSDSESLPFIIHRQRMPFRGKPPLTLRLARRLDEHASDSDGRSPMMIMIHRTAAEAVRPDPQIMSHCSDCTSKFQMPISSSKSHHHDRPHSEFSDDDPAAAIVILLEGDPIGFFNLKSVVGFRVVYSRFSRLRLGGGPIFKLGSLAPILCTRENPCHWLCDCIR